MGMFNARPVRLTATDTFRFALRSGSGIVYLVIFVLTALLVARMIFYPIEQMEVQLRGSSMETTPAEMLREFEDQARDYADDVLLFFTFVGRPTKAELEERQITPLEEFAKKMDQSGRYDHLKSDFELWGEYLLKERPSLLSALWLMLLALVPVITPLAAQNLYAGDIASRGLRFHLFRLSRNDIFLGRFLAVVAFNTLVVAGVVATVALYLSLAVEAFEPWAVISWSLHGFLVLSILSLPYLALTAWVSAAFDSPVLAFLLVALVIALVPIFAAAGRSQWEPAGYLACLLPWGVQTHLIHPDPLHWGGAALACIGYTIVFLALGLRRFNRRDL